MCRVKGCAGKFCGLDRLNDMVEGVGWRGHLVCMKIPCGNNYPQLTDDPYSFPRQENKLSAAIRRIIPPLRRMGVAISFDRRGHSGERTLRAERA